VTRSPERIAAIDVGSNTILLLIAEYDPSAGLTIIEEGEDQPRLGAGLSATGRLSEAAMVRAVQCLTRMREVCRLQGVGRIAAVATAAVREAENGEEFVERVHALDIPLRIISAATEAALSYRSAAHHFPAGGRTLVADIGGGSLELIGAVDGRIKLTQSLPLGAVRLTELRAPVATLREQIRRSLERALPRGDWAGSSVIGSGGTFAALGSMMLARRGVPSGELVHGTKLTTAEVERLLADLMALTPEERRAVPGLKPARADIIVAGVAVAAELLARVGAGDVTVSGFGVREGLLLEMVGAK
jgi:exopolyphosphatase/guanosine-5'-triphosphate,3'-diphosphate pyrophosphatase